MNEGYQITTGQRVWNVLQASATSHFGDGFAVEAKSHSGRDLGKVSTVACYQYGKKMENAFTFLLRNATVMQQPTIFSSFEMTRPGPILAQRMTYTKKEVPRYEVFRYNPRDVS